MLPVALPGDVVDFLISKDASATAGTEVHAGLCRYFRSITKQRSSWYDCACPVRAAVGSIKTTGTWSSILMLYWDAGGPECWDRSWTSRSLVAWLMLPWSRSSALNVLS